MGRSFDNILKKNVIPGKLKTTGFDLLFYFFGEAYSELGNKLIRNPKKI